jgi:uncharacterized membrane protein required for colicin V production
VNWVDIVIIVIVLGSAVSGLARGLVLQLGVILGFIAGFIVARLTYRRATDFLALFVHKDAQLAIVGFVVMLVLVWAFCITLAESARAVLRFTPFGLLDRIGGLIIGAIIGVFMADVLVTLAYHAQNASLLHSLHASQLAPSFRNASPNLWGLIPRHVLPLAHLHHVHHPSKHHRR